MNLFEEKELTTADRSTIENYSKCPAMARFIDSGQIKSVGEIAESGTQVHDACALTVQSYIDSGGSLSASDLASEVETNLRQSRPDVQPDAVDAFRYPIFQWAKHIAGTHYQNILRFDGGEGDRSGQLAWDIESLGMRVTSEVDLLTATASPVVLEETDYKTGHKHWTAEMVQNSFQFQLHGGLVLHNYPEIECLRVTIWNTRTNKRTYPTEFKRENLRQYWSRIVATAGEWFQHHDKKPEDAPTWPTREKCGMCDAAALCPVSDRDIRNVYLEPGKFVDDMVAVDSRLSEMKKLAAGYVKQHGDIKSDNGTYFGIGKPKADRKPTNQLYEVKNDGN